MKYTTYLNNAKMVEWGLNFSQGAVFDWLTLVPGWAEQMIEGKEVWYFASRTTCLKELPTVGTSEDTIYRIYKALEKLGLIEYKKVGVKDYIKLEKKAKEWHNKPFGNLSEHSEIYPNELGNPSENNSDENPTYNNITLDNNISDNNAREEIQHTPKEKWNDVKMTAFEIQYWGEQLIKEFLPEKKIPTATYGKEWKDIYFKLLKWGESEVGKNAGGIRLKYGIGALSVAIKYMSQYHKDNFTIPYLARKFDEILPESRNNKKKLSKPKETYHPTGGAVWEDPKNYNPRG